VSRKTERRRAARSTTRKTSPSVGDEVAGRVVSGLGEAGRFTELPWVQRQFRDRFGFLPFPGTLNLEVRGAAWAAARRLLRRETGVVLEPREGFCAAKCFRAVVGDNVEAVVVLPEVPGYPEGKLELVAAESIRRRLGLCDGDVLHVRILLDQAANRPS